MPALTVQNPGRLLDGLEGASEFKTGDITVEEADVEGEATITFDAPFDGAPVVVASARKVSASAGAAAARITEVEVTEATAAQCKVRVRLSAAPGAGENRVLRAMVYAAGKAKK